MTNRTPANSNAMAKGPEVIDAQVIDINPAPMQRGGSIQMAPRNTMRSNIQDGGWFDATQGKRKILFLSFMVPSLIWDEGSSGGSIPVWN
jgi:hypothetical protein